MSLTQADIAAAATRLKQLERQQVFDPLRPGSRPTKFQQEVIDDFLKVRTQHTVAGNRSGKSQLGAWFMRRVLAEDSADWRRPLEWGTAPLQFMLIGRVSKQVEEALYRKVRAFFDEGELHETRIGNALQKVTHRRTKNSLLFASHHNATEAREKVQAYELHGVWLDEMPSDFRLIEEIERRLQDRHGFLFSSFTPKVRNPGVRKKVDAIRPPDGKQYKLRMMDNPIYTEEDKAAILRSLEGMPESYRRCVLEGDWLEADTAAYSVPDSCIRTPVDYGPHWRHVESADPALQSKHGRVVFAECPASGHWWIVRADYVSGIYVPEDLVRAVTEPLKGLNIVRRVCDPASTWYIGQASKMGFTYTTPWDKNNRRPEMMKNLQAGLGTRLFVAPWCSDFTDELADMQWSENSEAHIVNQHSYHLHDAGIYGFDCLPGPATGEAKVPELHVRLRILQEQRRAAESRPKRTQGSRLLQPFRITRRSTRGLL